MNAYYVVRSSRPADLVSFGLLNGLPYACVGLSCEKPPVGFGLERLATAFMNNSGYDGFASAGIVGQAGALE